ncbi:MAG TPA: NAD-dependent epimerase/dehydratase [Rhizomicrobium sp.]|jgi:nucleoside-diphosphate-sugar epimerase|nr:NAD-dependent epimerase/dehydratase [Rhizomicrobium sp.]
MRILVTGGAGYIGSILVPELLSRGHEVTVVDSFVYRQNSLLDCCASRKFRVIRGDVRDTKIMDTEYARHDAIVPLAAIVGAPACKRQPEATKAINVGVVRDMVGKLSREQMLLYPVTNSGYGIGETGKMCTEESPLRPISLYGTTKVEAERILLDTGQAVTFRLATVFGAAPRMRVDLLVNDFVYRAVYDRFVVLFEAHFKRNYIHVRDVTNAFLFGMDNFGSMKGQTYNVGLSDANLSKAELCAVIKKHLPDFHVLQSEIGQDPDKRDYIVSNEKIEKAGWHPQHSLDSGIVELIKCYTIIRNAAAFDNLG